MKKRIKTLRRRGLALFLALTLCMSMSLTAFAAEDDQNAASDIQTEAASADSDAPALSDQGNGGGSSSEDTTGGSAPEVSDSAVNAGDGGAQQQAAASPNSAAQDGQDTAAADNAVIGDNASDRTDDAIQGEHASDLAGDEKQGADALAEVGDAVKNGSQVSLDIDLTAPENSSVATADNFAAGDSGEASDPGQVKKEESLDEMATPPEGYTETGDGSYSKTETGDKVQEVVGKKTYITETSTEYEWTREPSFSKEDGHLQGYITTTYATTTIVDTVQHNDYTGKPQQGGLNNLDRQLMQQGYTNVSHTVSQWDETGTIALVYTRTGEKVDPVTGAIIKIVQNYDTNAGYREEIVTSVYEKQMVSQKEITIEQNADGTITYHPSVSDDSSAVIPSESLKPDITTNGTGSRPDSNHLYQRPDEIFAHVNSEYVYQWIGEYGPTSAIYINAAGKEDGNRPTDYKADGYQGGFLILRDNKGYAHYVYCADMTTLQKPGTAYDIENVDNAEYMTGDAASKVQTVALNGYWGKDGDGIGSLEYVKEHILKNS